jgi:hypothetical protein
MPKGNFAVRKACQSGIESSCSKFLTMRGAVFSDGVILKMPCSLTTFPDNHGKLAESRPMPSVRILISSGCEYPDPSAMPKTKCYLSIQPVDPWLLSENIQLKVVHGRATAPTTKLHTSVRAAHSQKMVFGTVPHGKSVKQLIITS